MTLEPLYTIKDVAAALGMSERWVRGKIKGTEDSPPVAITRLGHKVRFTAAQYDEFVSSHAKGPATVVSITTGRRKS